MTIRRQRGDRKTIAELINGRVNVRHADKDAVDAVMSAWHLAFAGAQTQRRKTSWHTFSYNETPALEGEEALTIYSQQGPGRYYVVELPPGVLYECSGTLPAAAEIIRAISGRGDCYLVGKDLSWTFVVTHESDCGPYFARAKNAKTATKLYAARRRHRAK